MAKNNNYIVPEFNDELISELTNERHIIYKKQFKQETYLNQPLSYINYTYNDKHTILYGYGHKPDNYIFIGTLGELYLCNNKPFF